MEIANSIVPVLILLATGIVAAILSRLMRVSPIVGYLILGAAVSAIRPDLLSAGGTVDLLAELGVVFLLFDIGLHFSIAHVRQEAGDIFGFGPLQVAASAMLLGVGARALGSAPVTSFVVGATLALSSTAIVVGVIAERRLAAGEVFLWCDPEPRTMAGSARPTKRAVAVNAVYTPPEWRRRGYASACVAELSRLLLRRGFEFCVLYTDLENPTSNAIYTRIGYRPVRDFLMYDLREGR